MYKEHPSFESVPDNTKIWRFMDLAKFCDLLEKGGLFFASPASFKDPWEGYLPRKHYVQGSYEGLDVGAINFQIKMSKETLPALIKRSIGVSCWHIGEYESEAFWKNYSERGIAIQTTFKKLKESFKNSKQDIYIGKITYKDPDTDIVDVSNLFNHVLWKRKSFEYENEIRAVTHDSSAIVNDQSSILILNEGLNLEVDLDTLIETVYTTPFEEGQWFYDIVRDLIERYGFKFPCYKSKLMDFPF